MSFFKQLQCILTMLGMIVTVFISVSLLDVLIAFFYYRFYSNPAFIVLFGVGGIFAASLGYFTAADMAPRTNKSFRRSLIITLIVTGLLCFFFFSKLEAGEYEAAFKAFGATLTLGSLLFIKEKVQAKS